MELLKDFDELKPDLFDDHGNLRIEGMVAVFFYTTWAPPARAMATIFKEFTQKHPDRATYLVCNADTYPSVQRDGVHCVPTVHVFRNGLRQTPLVGLRPFKTFETEMLRMFEGTASLAGTVHITVAGPVKSGRTTVAMEIARVLSQFGIEVDFQDDEPLPTRTYPGQRESRIASLRGKKMVIRTVQTIRGSSHDEAAHNHLPT